MEFLLINHPLDCPVCDKGGECPLQNQAMSNGRGESRFSAGGGVKRTFPKPINISAQVLLDRERCVLCARCTRFSEQIAGDPFIALIERGALQQVGIYEKEPFESYFSGNAIQICPVGALTSADYRFRSRPFDLVSSPVGGRARRVRRGDPRRPPPRQGDAPPGRQRPRGQRGVDHRQGPLRLHLRPRRRPASPTRRCATRTATCVPASWSEAFAVAARGLAAAGDAAVLTGGRLTAEDAYAYAKFARVALGTNDIDFRARPHVRRGGRLPGRRRRAVRRGDLRRPGDRAIGRADRPGARGRGRHDLPAAAQGAPRQAHADLVGRRGPHPRPGQARRHAASRRSGRGGRRSSPTWPTTATWPSTPAA